MLPMQTRPTSIPMASVMHYEVNNLVDRDGDGIEDVDDNCPDLALNDQTDSIRWLG